MVNFEPGNFSRLFYIDDMKNITLYLIALLMLSTFGCKRNAEDVARITSADTIVVTDTLLQQKLRNEHMVLATLYHQRAAEYRALCYQAFNIGKLMLDKDLADAEIEKHRIVVLDVDETVLDNSPFQAKSILESTSYPTYWIEWCELATAAPLPGAIDFLNYARKNGVSVFYVTNRNEALKEVTIKNLKEAGFPHADEEHVIMRTAEASKEGRRQVLLKKYHISLFFGDNLNDFAETFEGKSSSNRFQAVDDNKENFGKRFIVLPNAMYGDWEMALYGYNGGQPDSVLFDIRRKNLKSF
ncbi:MAG TPA: 5'-nucleotidase, lipoprotein e(P4) family [Bacteroidales bacterium]|jgi:5'-nucleotidase (lipoprotein e(P4) family)|nr:5'-nucleotidase, lipoprotein e(P4) family [Bacteroidales bacterium]